MRERRFLIEPVDLREGRAWIRGAEHRHLAKVLRLRAGEPVVVFDGHGRGFHARLEAVEPSCSVAVLGEPEPRDAEPRIALTVLASVLHGGRMEGLVEKATEVGAVRIVPVLAARSIVKASSGGWGKLDRLRRIAVAAAKQSGRLVVPEVTEPAAFDEVLRGAGAADEETLRLIFVAGGRDPALLAQEPPPRRASILVGPEGGWTREEVAAAEAAGWRATGLGMTTLRADTAATVAAALVLLLAGSRASARSEAES